mgnify:CR=1 FL=1
MKNPVRTAACLIAGLAFLSLSILSVLADDELRTWTSADGQHTTQAAFLGFKDGRVQLRRADGKEVAATAHRHKPGQRG